MQYELADTLPGVYTLAVHLPDEQDVYFWDKVELEDQIGSGQATKKCW
jgi:hypothetical protein